MAGWLKKLRDDRKPLIHAAAQAQHAADYILRAPRTFRKSAARRGIRWHYTRTPIIGMELEIDARAVAREIALAK